MDFNVSFNSQFSWGFSLVNCWREFRKWGVTREIILCVFTCWISWLWHALIRGWWYILKDMSKMCPLSKQNRLLRTCFHPIPKQWKKIWWILFVGSFCMFWRLEQHKINWMRTIFHLYPSRTWKNRMTNFWRIRLVNHSTAIPRKLHIRKISSIFAVLNFPASSPSQPPPPPSTCRVWAPLGTTPGVVPRPGKRHLMVPELPGRLPNSTRVFESDTRPDIFIAFRAPDGLIFAPLSTLLNEYLF